MNLGADTHDVRRLMLAECRVAVFIFLHMHGVVLIKRRARNGSNLSQAVSSTSVTFCPATATFSHSKVLSLMIIPISGHAL